MRTKFKTLEFVPRNTKLWNVHLVEDCKHIGFIFRYIGSIVFQATNDCWGPYRLTLPMIRDIAKFMKQLEAEK